MRFTIDHQCPQCGAPAVLEEAERLFQCEFCRVRSYLLGGRFFCYRFAPKDGERREVIYVPYWRLKGMMFLGNTDGVGHRFVDTSMIAVESDRLPASVGLRSQALKLTFVAADTPGVFIKPTLPIRSMLDLVEHRFADHDENPTVFSTFVGENLSLIYAPFYKTDRVYDAVLEQAVDCPVSEVEALRQGAEKPNRPIRFIPVICPHCGWDLSGERDSLTLQCLNCQSCWMSTGKGLMRLKFGIAGRQRADSLHMPFWRIRTAVTGLNLDSFADLIRCANLPMTIQTGMDGQPFYFWVPAFKVRPRIFLRLSRKLTLAQPRQDLADTFPPSGIYPVTLPVTEAVESLKIQIAGFAKPADEIMRQLLNVEIQPQRFKLVYLPFEEEHHEFFQPDFHLTIHKNMLSMAKNL